MLEQLIGKPGAVLDGERVPERKGRRSRRRGIKEDSGRFSVFLNPPSALGEAISTQMRPLALINMGDKQLPLEMSVLMVFVGSEMPSQTPPRGTNWAERWGILRPSWVPRWPLCGSATAHPGHPGRAPLTPGKQPRLLHEGLPSSHTATHLSTEIHGPHHIIHLAMKSQSSGVRH